MSANYSFSGVGTRPRSSHPTAESSHDNTSNNDGNFDARHDKIADEKDENSTTTSVWERRNPVKQIDQIEGT